MLAPLLLLVLVAPVVLARSKNAEEFARIRDPKQECKWYGEPTLSKLLRTQFPEPGHIASIVDGDDDAQSVWQEIKKSGIIPKHVAIKEATAEHRGIASSQLRHYDKSDPDCWWTHSKCTKPKSSSDKIPHDLERCEEPSTWGLTFDDGPHCAHNKLYDYLAQNKIRASMFFIGTNVVTYPLQAQRALVDGHDICVHTWSHRVMTSLTDEQVFAELYYTAKAIKTVTGVTPRCWRPPFGDVDDRVRAIAASLGLRNMLWEMDTDDWLIDEGKSKSDVEHNYENIIAKARDHSPIVLAHELSSGTMETFINMYPKIKEAYKHVVPLTACLNATHPYPEDVTYPSFAEYVSGDIGARGQPSGQEIKVSASAKYDPVPLNKQKNRGSFMVPAAESKSKPSRKVDTIKKTRSVSMSSSSSSSSSEEPSQRACTEDQCSSATRSGISLVTLAVFLTAVLLW